MKCYYLLIKPQNYKPQKNKNIKIKIKPKNP